MQQMCKTSLECNALHCPTTAVNLDALQIELHFSHESRCCRLYRFLVLGGALPGAGQFLFLLWTHLGVFVGLFLFVQSCLLLLAALVICSADLLQL